MKTFQTSHLLCVATLLLSLPHVAAASGHSADLNRIVSKAIQPLQQQYNIPGIAVAISQNGQQYFYNAGVQSKDSPRPISPQTLFEIGSISKTLTATLASYAQTTGHLALSDRVSKYLPALEGSRFDHINLINLGTHTTGGFSVQVPDSIHSQADLIAYLRQWQPDFAPGTSRRYANLSIGMLGMISATSMQQPFEAALREKILRPLGMNHTYIDLPAEQSRHYAQGYRNNDAPVRLAPGFFATEAYAIKTSSADLIRFVEANMQVHPLDPSLQRAITDTHTGYFKAGEITQDLIWEQYPYPTSLTQLLDGNADKMINQPVSAVKLTPPLAPQQNVLINKTGSTNGFAAYVAYIPAKKLGIVILANKSYPIKARVTAAYEILQQLVDQP